MARSTIVNLSLAQAGGLIVTTIGSIGVWFIAASIASPADLGVLGRVISTGTLIASLLTAGLGQFLLTVVRSSTIAQVRRFLWSGLASGGIVSALIAFLITLVQTEHSLRLAFATSLMATGVAITNVQDSVYLSTQQARDVPLKSAALVFSRLILLITCTFVRLDSIGLISLFLLTQLGVGFVWILIRMPVALRRHANTISMPYQQHKITTVFVLSYLYSIAVAAIITGVPAIITSFADPQTAGTFYMAWTVAAVLGSVSIAVANSIVAVTLGSGQQQRRFLYMLSGLFAALLIGACFIIVVAPLGLVRLHSAYSAVSRPLALLAIGEVFFGIAIVSLAVYRGCAVFIRLATVLLAWPIGIVACVLVGMKLGGLEGASQGFAIGNGVAAVILCLLTLRAMHNQSPRFQATAVGA